VAHFSSHHGTGAELHGAGPHPLSHHVLYIYIYLKNKNFISQFFLFFNFTPQLLNASSTLAVFELVVSELVFPLFG
jgi:hypothetical protein